MIKKHIPWSPTSRVIKIGFIDYQIVAKISGKSIIAIDHRISLASTEYSAITANFIIRKMIRGNKNV